MQPPGAKPGHQRWVIADPVAFRYEFRSLPRCWNMEGDLVGSAILKKILRRPCLNVERT